MSKSKSCVSASSDDVVPEKGAALTDSCDARSLAKYKKTVPSEEVNYKLIASLQANTHCHIQVTELLQLNKVNKVRRHCFVVLLKNKKDYLCYFYAYIWLLLRHYSCNITLLLMVLVLVHSHYKLSSLWLTLADVSVKHQPNINQMLMLDTHWCTHATTGVSIHLRQGQLITACNCYPLILINSRFLSVSKSLLSIFKLWSFPHARCAEKNLDPHWWHIGSNSANKKCLACKFSERKTPGYCSLTHWRPHNSVPLS